MNCFVNARYKSPSPPLLRFLRFALAQHSFEKTLNRVTFMK